MIIDNKKVENIKLDGVEVSRILDAFGTVLYKHQSVPPRYIKVDIDTDYYEYPTNAYIQVDDGDPIYLTEPLYIEVTHSTHITGDGGTKWSGWSLNGVYLAQFRTFDIATSDLNEGDNDIVLISMS